MIEAEEPVTVTPGRLMKTPLVALYKPGFWVMVQPFRQNEEAKMSLFIKKE